MTSATATLPAPPAALRVTPDDLLRMGSDGKGYELVDGKLEELAVSFLSSYVAGRVYTALVRHTETAHPGWVVPEGTSFQCFPDDPDRVRKPDTAYLALGRLTARQAMTEGHCPVVPDLVVEVVSPNDYAKVVDQKLAEWRAAGVRLIWVIYPDTKTVYAYRKDQPGTADVIGDGDTLTAKPVLPGFAVPVAELFTLPTPAPQPGAATA